MPYDSANVLGGGSSSTSVVEGVCLISQEVKGDARWHFEAMGEGIDPAFHARVVVEGIAVEVAELRGVPLQGGASKRCGNVGFDKGRSLEGYQALKTLDEEHYVPVINVFAHQYYLTLSMRSIEVGVKVAQVGLVSSLRRGFWQGVSTRECFRGSVRVRRRGRRRGLFQEQGFLDHFPKGEHLVLVHGLNSGNGCGHSR